VATPQLQRPGGGSHDQQLSDRKDCTGNRCTAGIGYVATFVASPAASYVNGAILTVGGGEQAIKPAA
jgi:NAD(P)-dependent dehydrogenase (short-subunit alcohol dehydrogenase family)